MPTDIRRILSLVPLVSFIILAGNAIATSSSADLDLLSSVLAVLAPTAETSPFTKKIHDACERFSQIAGVIVSAAATRGSVTVAPAEVDPVLRAGSSAGTESLLPDVGEQPFGFPMALEDWDSVMMGYESELGSTFDARTLTGIIEPYMPNSGW